MTGLLVKKILRRLDNVISKRKKRLSAIDYWMWRAKQYGKRSVLNIEHPEGEFDAVTQMQKDEIFPFLTKQLRGNEKLVLDLGCGPGRFTADLANMIHGYAVGVDPIKYLLDLAPKSENTKYRLMEEGIIGVETHSVDVVWICLVLGGIIDDSVLRLTIDEVNRVLKTDGLVLLIENTAEGKDSDYWRCRSVKTYQNLFYFVELKHFSDYFDMGERISIMGGRRDVQVDPTI